VADQPVSGRYLGTADGPAGGDRLELRIDVDRRFETSPSLNRVSGDLFSGHALAAGEKPWSLYRLSWLMESPTTRRQPSGAVTIEGDIAVHAPAVGAGRARIEIPRPGGQATVTLTIDAATRTFRCDPAGAGFRNLRLEVDFCTRVGSLRPVEYDTGLFTPLPGGVTARPLDIKRALADAGIDVNTIVGAASPIDDSAAELQSWSDRELHGALHERFSGRRVDWPNWLMWGLMAEEHERGDAGIMFDRETGGGVVGGNDGTGDPDGHERQGFAVFRKHVLGSPPPPGAPSSVDDKHALRFYFFTWIHEMGHAFNMRHSLVKGRPSGTLSWMNDEGAREARTGHFWSNFGFAFDELELHHLRHGSLPSIIMGAQGFGLGNHLGRAAIGDLRHALPAAAPQASCEEPLTSFDAPVELLLRGRGYYDFMSPVRIEARLRNRDPQRDVQINARLQPEDGGLAIFIQRPTGETVEYRPSLYRFRDRPTETLRAAGVSDGSDRYSEELNLTYGCGQFYFDTPGSYVVHAVYRSAAGALIVSNACRLRIGHPLSRDMDVLAQDFFSRDVGEALYLRGSHARHLSKGFDVLRGMTERYRSDLLGADLSSWVVKGIGERFFRLQEGKMVRFKTASPAEALKATEEAIEVFARDDRKAFNLPHRRLAATRADYLARDGDFTGAGKEMDRLAGRLRARDANEIVVQEVQRERDDYLSGRCPPWDPRR
jgi:hypothetical protein